jgi:hypothetical protein
MSSTSDHRGHRCRRVVQKKRSRRVNVGRGRWRFSTATWLSEREDLKGGIAATADEHADGCQDCEHGIEHGSTLVTEVMLE